MRIINYFLKLTLFSFIIYISISFFHVSVYAYDGSIPYINPGFVSFSAISNITSSAEPIGFTSGPYSVYASKRAGDLVACVFNVNSAPAVSSSRNPTYRNFTYEYQGIVYNVYCSLYTLDYNVNLYDGVGISGTRVYADFSKAGVAQDVAKYFLFGVGDFDIELAPQDIPDSSLDIVGLNAWVGSDQYFGADDNSVSSAFSNFIESLVNSLIPNSASSFVDSNKVFTNQLGTVRTTIPGINLIWDSPSVGVNLSGSYPDINPTYSFWVDGSTSATLHLYQHKDTCNLPLNKFELYSGQIYDNPNTTSYYNTNSSYSKILDFVADNNSSFSSSIVENVTTGSCVLDTSISRVYIQASLIDLDGNIHKGAVSYVDISSDGSCFVYEGVTENLDDIPSSSDEGLTNEVDQPLTVSGDTIIYGDTITNNNTTNIISSGLTVGDGTNFFSAGLALINAILELIKLLFVSWLVPLIKLGWTGTP